MLHEICNISCYVYDDLRHRVNCATSFRTNIVGRAYQHLQYFPFGELFVSQRNSSFDSRYKFSAKELDNETGYSYFGARYYDSDLSSWLSVDPLSDKYLSLSPYMYCAGNPVMLVDIDGKEIWINYKDKNGNMQSYKYGSDMKIPDNPFVQTTIDGLSYLMSNGLNNEINQLNNDERPIYISYGSTTCTINEVSYWNPKVGKQSENGEISPPIIGLSNEMGHQWYRLFMQSPTYQEAAREGFLLWEHPNSEDKRGQRYNPTTDYSIWGGFEEFFVIHKFDNKVLSSTNKALRNGNSGIYIETDNPYSANTRSDGIVKDQFSLIENP